MKLSHIAAAALALASLGANAALTSTGDACSLADLTNAVATDCAGYFVGNLNNNADFADVAAMLSTEFGVTSTGRIEQINAGTGSFSLAAPVTGLTVVGVHWGGGAGGGGTGFFLFDAGAGMSTLTVETPNDPFRGVSNLAVYSTGGTVAAIPEPETYALMLAGLAVVAGVSRRRARK